MTLEHTATTLPIRRTLTLVAAAVLGILVANAQTHATAEPIDETAATATHAIAMHGKPKYPENFPHFSYVNPDAPNGGRLTLGELGSFDSLNPFIIKGQPAAGLRDYIYESLLARGRDEPFTLYAQIASRVEVPADRSSITFHLNPKAHFSDGDPITTDDVLFSWNTLREHGRPNHRTYYAKVKRAERHGDHKITFHFDDTGDRELPLILGLMPVLPSHLLTPDTFTKTTLAAPVGSGPYTITDIDPGRALTYTRDTSWWGRDLPTNRGRFNFHEVRFEYYRDSSAMFEAFKGGTLDLRPEQSPAHWAESYNVKPVRDGRIKKSEFEIGLPAGMTGLAFNTRRDVFKDIRVRKALTYMFDFEWINQSLYHGLYKRTHSYFERSHLSAFGQKPDATERRLLAPYTSVLDPSIMDGSHQLPKSSGSGQNRKNWHVAVKLLTEAGYKLAGSKMINAKTGNQLSFEMLAASPSQERLFLSFSRDLARIGIAANVRMVDSSQYQSRLKTYDYDMIQYRWRSSLSPGNEQLFRWSSDMVDRPGTFNFPGVANPAVDAMIGEMLKAKTASEFVSAVRALDRVLRSGHYAIPLFHLPRQWIAHWTRIKPPSQTPVFGYQLDTWWHGAPATAENVTPKPTQ